MSPGGHRDGPLFYMNEALLLMTGLLSVAFVYLSWRLSKERLYTAIVVFLALIATVGGKLVEFFGFETNAGNVFYASIFLATYLLIERYGKREGLRSIWIAIIAVGFFTAFLQISALLEGTAETASLNQALDIAFGSTVRVSFASLLAYALSQTLNVHLYAYLKQRMQGTRLWLRANITNAVAQVLDSVAFFFIAFAGAVPPDNMWEIIITGIVIKVVFVMVASPLLYLNHIELNEEDGSSSVTVH